MNIAHLPQRHITVYSGEIWTARLSVPVLTAGSNSEVAPYHIIGEAVDMLVTDLQDFDPQVNIDPNNVLIRIRKLWEYMDDNARDRDNGQLVGEYFDSTAGILAVHAFASAPGPLPNDIGAYSAMHASGASIKD